jgi:phage baseplate assembly protein V
MAIDLSQYIFVGLVSTLNPSEGTVVVVRPDKDNRPTAPLRVLQRGTKETKEYWMPAIDDQVLCILLPNSSGKGPSEGYVVGAVYSDVDPPSEDAATTRSIKFPDGSLIQYKGGDINIHAAGNVNITSGGVINLN